MSKVGQLFIPEKNLEILSEIEKVDLIARKIKGVKIDPSKLVYCGIEGKLILSRGKLPERGETFGFTYIEFRDLADDKDRYGSANEDNPLDYALMADHVPAMVTYDESGIVESHEGPNIWLPKPGGTLAEAARVVIFFAQ
jgi:hypothetical protein